MGRNREGKAAIQCCEDDDRAYRPALFFLHNVAGRAAPTHHHHTASLSHPSHTHTHTSRTRACFVSLSAALRDARLRWWIAIRAGRGRPTRSLSCACPQWIIYLFIYLFIFVSAYTFPLHTCISCISSHLFPNSKNHLISSIIFQLVRLECKRVARSNRKRQHSKRFRPTQDLSLFSVYLLLSFSTEYTLY